MSERELRVGLVLALFVAAVLRCHGLGAQVVGGDEIHALERALSPAALATILFEYRRADYSQPLTGFYRVLTLAGFELSEWSLRAPVLFSGLVFVVLVPCLLRPHFDRTTVLALAALFALSPPLVLWSRIVRSYMPMTLLVALASVFCWRFFTNDRSPWRPGLLYAGCAALAVYFHLGAAPAALVPLPVLAALKLAGVRGAGKSWAGIVGVAAATAACLLAFAVPAWNSLLATVFAKANVETLAAADLPWRAAALLHAGTASRMAAAAFWLAALFGACSFARRSPAMVMLGVLIVTAQIGSILLLRPPGIASSNVLARYLLPALPVVLLGVAIAASGLAKVLARWMAPRWSLAALAVLYLAATPLWRPGFLGGPFSHRSFSAYRETVLPAAAVPEIYRRLEHAGGVIEGPWHPYWGENYAFAAYAAHHRRLVRVLPGLVAWQALTRHPRFGLRNWKPAEPGALLESGCRYLLLHLDPGGEEEEVRQRMGRVQAVNGRIAARMERDRAAMRRAAQEWSRSFSTHWGRPDHAAAGILAWDLDRVRRRASAEAGEP